MSCRQAVASKITSPLWVGFNSDSSPLGLALFFLMFCSEKIHRSCRSSQKSIHSQATFWSQQIMRCQKEGVWCTSCNPKNTVSICFRWSGVTGSRSSILKICLMITEPISTLGLRLGLPVELVGFCLWNKLTNSHRGITELSVTRRLEGSKPL
jgi:hypothetical protein